MPELYTIHLLLFGSFQANQHQKKGISSMKYLRKSIYNLIFDLLP